MGGRPRAGWSAGWASIRKGLGFRQKLGGEGDWVLEKLGPEEVGSWPWVARSPFGALGLTQPLAGKGWNWGLESLKRTAGLAQDWGLLGSPLLPRKKPDDGAWFWGCQGPGVGPQDRRWDNGFSWDDGLAGRAWGRFCRAAGELGSELELDWNGGRLEGVGKGDLWEVKDWGSGRPNPPPEGMA